MNDHIKNTDNENNQGDKIEGDGHNKGSNDQSEGGDEADNIGHNIEEVDSLGIEENQDDGG
jgi:hypothetical protein